MKNLIRRFSRVGDSSNYSLLQSNHRPRSKSLRRGPNSSVPEGHIPVYVGDEMERFVVPAEILNHWIFAELLNRSAQEYGYEQKGVLHIPCHVIVFERVLEALRLGDPSLLDLIASAL